MEYFLTNFQEIDEGYGKKLDEGFSSDSMSSTPASTSSVAKLVPTTKLPAKRFTPNIAAERVAPADKHPPLTTVKAPFSGSDSDSSSENQEPVPKKQAVTPVPSIVDSPTDKLTSGPISMPSASASVSPETTKMAAALKEDVVELSEEAANAVSKFALLNFFILISGVLSGIIGGVQGIRKDPH
jgi:hypothetical protein